MALLRRTGGEPGAGGQVLGVTPAEVSWRYISFAAYRLTPGETLRGNTGQNETALVVLGGRCTVESGSTTFPHIGERPDVWAKTPPFVALLPPGHTYAVTAETPLHLVVASAPAEESTASAPRLIRPADAAIEH